MEKTSAAIREKRPKAKLKPRLKKILKVKNARKNVLRPAPAGMKTNRKSELPVLPQITKRETSRLS